MSVPLLLAAVALAVLSGVPGLFVPAGKSAGERVFVLAMALAGGLGIASALAVVVEGEGALALPWSVPGGRLALEVDALSAMFLLQVAVIAPLGACYGLAYWSERAHPESGRRLRVFYGLTSGAMLLLVAARNAILFLASWEVMALSAFMLVGTEDEKPVARAASHVYLLATRFGTLLLFAMFTLAFASTGTLDFDGLSRALASPLRDAIFVLGLLGFGLKAGLMPLHLWLPGAHANAPSHVSALLSGVLIKMGIYGIVRLVAACAAPPAWWGAWVLALGALSGVLGVSFAIGQHDLKRLLAYHSVENIGIIAMGLGVALLGQSAGHGELVVLGLGGALLHVWNHGAFKALLFLSAGAVVHATGTREIDRLGGLARKLPWTSRAFLLGAVAICGLPPLNGLVSELLVYLALFRTSGEGGSLWLAGALGGPALALIGALAVACFVKVFGAVFLGEPRTHDADAAHEAGGAMRGPMAALAGVCLLIGLAPMVVVPMLDRAIADFATREVRSVAQLAPLGAVSATGLVLLALIGLAARAARRWARQARRDVGTWDCGYAAPSARMQYSSSSFAQMLVALFGWALRPEVHAPRIEGPFPAPSRFHSEVPDAVLDRAVAPCFRVLGGLFERLHRLQSGNVHLYLVYIVVALIALLAWSGT